ncbi:UNVERIFIED_CONTAM: hypothetical protein Slati_3998800 [Sesamum latifolium]|uniref:Uncharacterized protein n=1 Tax=Sesamum latifolium TaxID=2727402 RepID=A0AAW2TQV4_9LAMI
MAPRLLSCFRSPSGSKYDDKVTADFTAEEQQRGGPVVVELFSSQGCATSPEAELLFSRLGRGDFNLEVPLVLLAYHVDYWDYMGWKDPFGSSQWTVRQKAYVEALRLDTMFTPQIVVQGRATVSPMRKRLCCPASRLHQESLHPCSRTKVDHEGANVMVALCECGLVTDCPSGANKGRVLANDYVVRRLEKLVSLKDVSAKKAVSGTATFSLWEGFNPTKCKLAVFVQNSSHQIFGSQNIPLPDRL